MSSTEKNEGCEGVPPKPHPLLISVVLKNLLDQSDWSFEDLKRMRSVCKVWYDHILSQWRSAATVCILQERRPSARRNGILLEQLAAEVLGGNEDVHKLKSVPFIKYKLTDWRFDRRNNVYDFLGNWDKVSSPVRQLIWEKCTFDMEDSRIFYQVIYNRSPELHHLVLDSCESTGQVQVLWTPSNWIDLCYDARNPKIDRLDVSKWMPFKQPGTEGYYLYEVFLKSFPGLKTLKMSEMEEELPPDWDTPEIRRLTRSIFLTYGNLTPDDLPHLRQLDIMHWNLALNSETDITGPLERFRFPLEFLTVSLNSVDGIGRELSAIVASHSETLRVLKIFVAPHHPIQPYSLEHCPDLLIEDLELWGTVLDDFGFLLKMPQLKKLKVDYGCFDKWKFMEKSYSEKAVYPVSAADIMEQTFKLRPALKPSDFVVMEHLTDFHIDVQFGAREIKLIGKWMPNLRSFKSVFDAINFQILLREWRDMEKLMELHALFGSELDDFTICGFPEDNQYPNISWLKELKHFSSEAYCNMGQFTDRSAMEGFLKLNLCSIKICVSPEFSEEMEQTLKEFIALVDVIRNYGDHTGECCRRLLFKKKALVPKDLERARASYRFLQREDLVEAGSLM